MNRRQQKQQVKKASDAKWISAVELNNIMWVKRNGKFVSTEVNQAFIMYTVAPSLLEWSTYGMLCFTLDHFSHSQNIVCVLLYSSQFYHQLPPSVQLYSSKYTTYSIYQVKFIVLRV